MEGDGHLLAARPDDNFSGPAAGACGRHSGQVLSPAKSPGKQTGRPVNESKSLQVNKLTNKQTSKLASKQTSLQERITPYLKEKADADRHLPLPAGFDGEADGSAA